MSVEANHGQRDLHTGSSGKDISRLPSGEEPSVPKKQILVLRGFTANDLSLVPIKNHIRKHTLFEPHSLDLNSLKKVADPRLLNPVLWPELLDVNVWICPREERRIKDKVKELNDKSQEKVTILGQSLGGRKGVIFALENPDKVDKAIALQSPVGDLRGYHEDVTTVSIYSYTDRLINPYSVLAEFHRKHSPWKKELYSPYNPEFDYNVPLTGFSHLAPQNPKSGIHEVYTKFLHEPPKSGKKKAA